MKLHVFQSAHGDCMLVESADGTLMLVDGGIKGSFREHALPTLAGFGADAFIDLVCVSHVDQDHIGGILAYLENLVKWRVFRHRRDQGRTAREPKEPELPEIGAIWHNAFHDTATANRGALERFLGLAGETLSGHANSELRKLGHRYTDLAESVGEGIEVSRRIADEQLGVPLNELWDGKLIVRKGGPDPIELGSLTMELLGPTEADLRELRKFWNDWLSTRRSQILKLRRRMARDEERLTEASSVPVREAAEDLAEMFGLAELGDRNEVTEPNLASIMLHVADSDGSTCLLTGDGHMEDVVKGLEATQVMQPGQGLHVDCLKIAHHGSEFNSDLPHYQRITADNYVFCGNGHSDNPDTRIVEAVVNSRVGTTSQRSTNPEASRNFKLWFNTDPDDDGNHDAEHMRNVRTKVVSRAASSGGSMRFAFQSSSVRRISL